MSDPTDPTTTAPSQNSPQPESSRPESPQSAPPLAPTVVDFAPSLGRTRTPRVLAIANQKGGVGKTTTAINLGTALAAIGEQVLIVDLDPQGNASTGLGIDHRSRRHSTYDVLINEATLRDAVLPTAVPRLFIATCSSRPERSSVDVAKERDRAYRLRTALGSLN